MNAFLWQTYHRLIAETDTAQHRFLFQHIDLAHRLTGIVGARGVGKTTLLLQYLKEKLYADSQSFYFSADNIYFSQVSILSFVDKLYQQQNIRIFFIDEIHKYENWNQELKNIYDSFPKVKIVFSGSSSIDLIKGAYDLSRRARLLYLPGMSFREYLNIKTASHYAPISFDDLLLHHQKIAAKLSQISKIASHFEAYKTMGYYPMVFQWREDLYPAIANIIEKTIYEDIANFYKLKTENLSCFKKIINFLATIPPGEVNTNNISNHLGVDNKTTTNYLEILSKTGLIKMLYPVATGHQLLSKPAKIYLDNTTLLAGVNTFLSEKIDIGTQRELLFMQFLKGAGLPVFYPKIGDFQVNEVVFEVGGRNKKMHQLASVKHYKKMVVKDDILVGFENQIPLYLFGFLY